MTKYNEKDELRGMLHSKHEECDQLKKEIINLQENIEKLLVAKDRLEFRLDACLYAMVLMQAHTRQREQSCKKNHIEKPSIAS